MSHLSRMMDLLPPPYTIAPDSIVSSVLDHVAIEMDAFQEDLDRYQRSHWIHAVYAMGDAEKMGALAGIQRLPWENLPFYRDRLLALVVALLDGATGPRQIRRFVYDYLSRAETVLDSTLVPGLNQIGNADDAYTVSGLHPRYRPLALRENPEIGQRSAALLAIDGNVPYLYRWKDANQGLTDTVATVTITGARNRTSVPVLVNLTTGELLGFAGDLHFGDRLSIGPGSKPGTAAATVNEQDATAQLFSIGKFALGTPFTKDQLDPAPRLPRMVRGVNEWLFLQVGLYGVRGLDNFYFAIADDLLREGRFDETSFDHALFPSGIKAKLELAWTETEPAAFDVHVPRYLVREPAGSADGPGWVRVEQGLRDSIGKLHGAGIRAGVRFDAFVEVQDQRVRFQLPFKALDAETAPSGSGVTLSFGGRFGESVLGGSRFE